VKYPYQWLPVVFGLLLVILAVACHYEHVNAPWMWLLCCFAGYTLGKWVEHLDMMRLMQEAEHG
jgi:hypothetical protein